jgi:PmbA protein
MSLDGEYGEGESRRALESEEEFEARVQRLVEMASHLRIAGEGGAPGARPVLLHPDVSAGLVIDTLLHHLDGRTVHKREGWFHREQFGNGRPVLRDDLSLRIDPLLPLEVGSYRFTHDGLPARRCDFIRGGALISPIASLKYARALGVAPTPRPQGNEAIVFESARTLTPAEAYAEMGDGALVLGVLGLHTLDTASGDFSLSAPQVLRVKSQGPAGRFRATISGNVLDVLRSPSLRLVRFPGERHPGLLFDCRLDPR